MYWNFWRLALAFCCCWININMRCIEIGMLIWCVLLLVRLTLTWDVLKSDRKPVRIAHGKGININMRCIEILARLILPLNIFLININMRCIEMTAIMHLMRRMPGININMRCIEIRIIVCLIQSCFLININMRCIEMKQ